MSTTQVVQGTPEWLALRAGKVTASRLSDVLSFSKKTGEELAGRRNYKAELVCEILTGKPYGNGSVSADMERGTALEPEARVEYSVHEGVIVDQVGFVQHPTIEMAGCSPDGVVGEDGLVEIKCPKSATHLDYLLSKGKVPTDYVPQMTWQLACTRRKWVDFVSYDPSFPPEHQLYIVRFEADESLIADYEDKVRQFLAEINGLLLQLGACEKVTA